MKNKKIGKILLIMIILILILGGIFAYLYFGTDLLKTNKQLFFKYLGQVAEQQDGFINSNLREYVNKKYTGKYEDSGKFYVDINLSGMDSDALKIVNDFNIEYAGKVDNTSRKNEQDISINYADNVSFPIKYKYANETLGLQTDYVSSKYIGIENNNLKEFVEKFGVKDTEDIPDTIDLFKSINNSPIINFTEEEKKQVKDTYQTILQEKIGEKEFTKTEENNVVNYSVQVTNQELKDLLVTTLETLKNDQIIMPKVEEALKEPIEMINENAEEKVTVQSLLEEYLDELNSSKVEEGTSTLTVSQTNRKLTGISLTIDNSELKITKSDEQGVLTYNLEVDQKDENTEDSVRYFMTLGYQGLEQMTSINETHQFGIMITKNGEEQKLVYNLNSTDTFKENINIEDYADNEIQKLNEYDGEQIISLLTAISERIGKVNTMQMEEIGFSEYGNPMLYAFPVVSLPLMMYNQATDVVEDNSMSETEKETFNQRFESYEGEQRGTNIKSLLQTVLSNNISQTEEDRKVQISGDIIVNKDSTEVPTNDVDISSTYHVEMKYNDEGMITEIIITKN